MGKSEKKIGAWKLFGAIIVCICAAGLGIFSIAKRFGFGPGSFNTGGHSNIGMTYMSYAGPVFPMTISEDVSGLEVERKIDFDFSPYRSDAGAENESEEKYDFYGDKSIVRDQYVLTNKTDMDKTVTAIYPFAGAFDNELNILPNIRLNGIDTETKLYAGPHSGSFEGAGGPEEEGLFNIASLDSWEEYKILVENGYMAKAFDAWPELKQTVTVYELSDRTAGTNASKAVNPTINMEFNIDYSRTTILTYGMNGGANDMETGYCARHTHVPEEFNPDYGQSAYLIVFGDDIRDYKMQGYRDGSCEKGKELNEAAAKVTRYETTLEEMIKILGNQFLDEREKDTVVENDKKLLSRIPREMFLGAAAELMYDSGMPGGKAIERYDFGMLEDLFSDVHVMKRVMYLTFELTIPAGNSVDVTASMIKKASRDFIGENEERNGYDMVTQLGSNLNFTVQTASISNTEDIEIIRQNFGFDLENNINIVELDKAQEHYYLEIQKRKE